MNEATVLLLDHNRNEIMVRNDAFLVETTLMARIDCKRLSSVTERCRCVFCVLRRAPLQNSRVVVRSAKSLEVFSRAAA
jgi:hypothetical protein